MSPSDSLVSAFALALVAVAGLTIALLAACSSRAHWKRRAEYRQATLDGIAQLDPAFMKVFGQRRVNLSTADWEYRLDGRKIQYLARVSRRKNDRIEDTTALKDALRELANERKAR